MNRDTPAKVRILVNRRSGFLRSFKAVQKAFDHYWDIRKIDVGTVNGSPFLVTCSMAWDAALVQSFEKSLIRGILPYVFAGVYEFLGYQPQPFTIVLDSGEVLEFPDPLVLTVANLTQYGGGVRIAPDAQPDDGQLELVVVRHQDVHALFANITKLLRGAINEIPAVVYRKFRSLKVQRKHPAPIQVDGELINASAELEITVVPQKLNILVPVAG